MVEKESLVFEVQGTKQRPRVVSKVTWMSFPDTQSSLLEVDANQHTSTAQPAGCRLYSLPFAPHPCSSQVMLKSIGASWREGITSVEAILSTTTCYFLCKHNKWTERRTLWHNQPLQVGGWQHFPPALQVVPPVSVSRTGVRELPQGMWVTGEHRGACSTPHWHLGRPPVPYRFLTGSSGNATGVQATM